MRPGCDRRASACLTYDAESSAVWLQDPGDIDEPEQLVCSVHAGSLTAPLGWTLTDRRTSTAAEQPEPVQGTLIPEDPPEGGTDAPLDGAGPGAGAVAEGPSTEDAPDEPEPASEPSSDPAPAGQPGGGPVPDPTPETAPEPAAARTSGAAGPRRKPRDPRSGPRKNGLLDRAFEWTGPQHSVLTTESPSAEPAETPDPDAPSD